MRMWLRTWLRVGAGIAVLGSLLWLLAERQISSAALLRSAVWGLDAWRRAGFPVEPARVPAPRAMTARL